MLDYREHCPLIGPRACPVARCRNRKGEVDLVCRKCWYQVPQDIRVRIMELWRNGKDREEHRRLCLETIATLSEAAEAQAPGRVRRWAEMTEAERARIKEQSRPPPPPTPAVAEMRRRQARAAGFAPVIAQRLVRETAKAVLFTVGGVEIWFPKSVIEDREQESDETWVLSVASWFAEKEGLLDG